MIQQASFAGIMERDMKESGKMTKSMAMVKEGSYLVLGLIDSNNV